MIEVGKTIVSRDVFKKEFVCNLSACKGECCIAGDAGAPLLDEEKEILDAIYPKVKPYMRAEGIEAVEQQGVSVYDKKDNEYETALVNNAECAFVIYGDDGTALCAIEKAYNEGDVEWQKPISCHLYPIRIKKYRDFDAINYDKWEICSDACTLGEELNVPVYRFLKDPLIRHYGEEWYADLTEIAALVEKEL
ncbi:MAG: DUF3109 family protein [Salibacteraceae bacterium]